MSARILMTLFLTGPLGGCSLVFTSGPPSESQRNAAFSCTTSYAAPILDVAWATYALATTAAEKQGGIGAEDVSLSALWIGSAAYGIWNVRRCRGAIEEANRRTDASLRFLVGAAGTPLGPVPKRSWPQWSAGGNR